MELIKNIIWFIFYIGVSVPFIFTIALLPGGCYLLYESISNSNGRLLIPSISTIIVSLAYFASYFNVFQRNKLSILPGCIMLVVSIAWTYNAIHLLNIGSFFSTETAKTIVYIVGFSSAFGSISNICWHLIELKTKKLEKQVI